MTNGHFHRSPLIWFTSFPNVDTASQHLQQYASNLHIHAKVSVWRHRTRNMQQFKCLTHML